MKAMAVLGLRFTEPEGREWKVPGNIRIGALEIPMGLAFIFLVLFWTACVNLVTKRVATISGSVFTMVFFIIFEVSERINAKSTLFKRTGLATMGTSAG